MGKQHKTPSPEDFASVPSPSKGKRKAGSRWLSQVFDPERLFLVALFLVGFVLGPRMVAVVKSDDVLEAVAQRPEYQLTAEQIELPEQPHWVPHDLVEQVWKRAGLAEEVSILEPTIVEQLATAFNQHPWIERVVTLRKEVPARIVVEVVYRKPVALVETEHGLYPIDAKGVLLPPADFSPAAIQQYPRIRNIHSLPRSTAGHQWGDVTVLAAAKVAEAILPHWEEFHLKAILAPYVQEEGILPEEMMFTLISVNGSQILWGRPPGTGHPAELPVEKKVGRLAQYQRDFGGLDDAHTPYEIDIRHWQEIARRPLPQQFTRKTRSL